jgi:hypothetical protein
MPVADLPRFGVHLELPLNAEAADPADGVREARSPKKALLAFAAAARKSGLTNTGRANKLGSAACKLGRTRPPAVSVSPASDENADGLKTQDALAR